jgi:hypothetical protein
LIKIGSRIVAVADKETYIYNASGLAECLFQQAYFLIFFLSVYHDSLRLLVVIPPLDKKGGHESSAD